MAATGAMIVAWGLPGATLSDPTGEPLPTAWRLHRPGGYGLLAPATTLWDQVAMLPGSRLVGFLAGLGLLYLLWRLRVRLTHRVRWPRAVATELRLLGTTLAGFVVFVLVGLSWQSRPVARLAGLDADELTVEVHSHTNASHDVRGWLVSGFDAEANRRWHERVGVDVVFVTDHNTTRGWDQFRAAYSPEQAQLCPGIEISAHGAHVLVLGTPLPDDHQPYRGSVENRASLVAEIGATDGAVAIAALPEYRGQVEQFIAEGVRGFEIVSASPKGNEFTRAERDSVMALARRHGLLLVGAGDQHGYGATPMVWNVMRLPGWRMAEGPPCAEIVARFRSGGPETVRVVERSRLRADHPLPWILTPLGVVWMAWASAGVAGGIGWLVWIWGATLAGSGYRLLYQRRRHAAVIQTLIPRRR